MGYVHHHAAETFHTSQAAMNPNAAGKFFLLCEGIATTLVSFHLPDMVAGLGLPWWGARMAAPAVHVTCLALLMLGGINIVSGVLWFLSRGHRRGHHHEGHNHGESPPALSEVVRVGLVRAGIELGGILRSGGKIEFALGDCLWTLRSVRAVSFDKNTNPVRATGTDMCAICRETPDGGVQVAELCCGHKFHGGCVGQWLVQHGTCPTCRRAIAVDPPLSLKRVDLVAYLPGSGVTSS